MIVIPVLFVIAVLPLLFYWVDGYYAKNMRRGSYMILAFLLTCLFGIVVIKLLKVLVIFVVPLFFVSFLSLGRLRKK
jgi:hypothetical protein